METPASDRQPDDNDPHPRDRHVPPALWWAAAVVVLAGTVAGFLALSKNQPKQSGAPVDRLDNSITAPGWAGLEPARDMVGQQAPDITFERFDGTTGSLQQYRGNPLVVNFFAAWCVPCITEMPGFEEAHRGFGEQVSFLGLNVTDGEIPARALLERMGITYDTGRDPDGTIIQSLGGVTMPTTVLITRDGVIVEVHSGEMSRSDLEREIHEKLLEPEHPGNGTAESERLGP